MVLLGVWTINARNDSSTITDDTPAVTGLGQADQTEITGTPLPAFSDGQDPAVGALAPVVRGHDFDGSPVDLGGETDTASIVVFMPHWCPHCQVELPDLVLWADDGTIPDDVRLVAVATSTDPGQNNFPPQEWFERESWPGEVLADSDNNAVAAAYGVTGFPFFVAIGTDGNVAARDAGELDQQSVAQMASSISTR